MANDERDWRPKRVWEQSKRKGKNEACSYSLIQRNLRGGASEESESPWLTFNGIEGRGEFPSRDESVRSIEEEESSISSGGWRGTEEKLKESMANLEGRRRCGLSFCLFVCLFVSVD